MMRPDRPNEQMSRREIFVYDLAMLIRRTLSLETPLPLGLAAEIDRMFFDRCMEGKGQQTVQTLYTLCDRISDLTPDERLAVRRAISVLCTVQPEMVEGST